MNISSSLTGFVNEVGVRGQAMVDLILQYATFPNGFYGFKSIGANEDIQFPALFVQPKSQMFDMETTAKNKLRITYAIYWYVRENDLDDVNNANTYIGEMLKKLFSNNALNDIGVANPPSNKYRNYANPNGGMYWLEAVVKSIDYSVAYIDPDVLPNMTYEASGRMVVEIMDILLE